MPSLAFPAIGTQWRIDTSSPIDPSVGTKIHARIAEFDLSYSRFRDDSLISTVATAAGEYEFPDDATRLFDLYDELFAQTDGAVTPLIGRALENLGYDPEYSLTRRSAGSPSADWTERVHRTGNRLAITEPVLIDVGAAGKGYLVDLIGELLQNEGIEDFVIDASGDILSRGGKPLRVALEHPLDPTMAIGVVTLAGGSICASGSNRRVWGEGLHHILDGRTGEPTTDVVATWAIADTALVADGLATALFFTEPQKLAQSFDFQYVRIFSSGRSERSHDLNGEVFA